MLFLWHLFQDDIDVISTGRPITECHLNSPCTTEAVPHLLTPCLTTHPESAWANM